VCRAKLNANPETRAFMADPSFVSKMQMIQQNPNAMGSMLTDPRMSKALGVLLGVDLTAMGGGAGGARGGPMGGFDMPMGGDSGSSGSGVTVDEDMGDSDDEDADGAVKDEKPAGGRFTKVGEMSAAEAEAARDATFKAAGKPMPPPTKVMTEEEKKAFDEEEEAKKAEAEAKAAKARWRAEADVEKNKGNELYKKREFPAAIEHYEKALSIDSSSMRPGARQAGHAGSAHRTRTHAYKRAAVKECELLVTRGQLVEQTWAIRAWADRLPLRVGRFFCLPRFSDPEIQ